MSEPVAWMIHYREITRGGRVRRVTSPSLVDEVPSMLLPWDENVISRELISSTPLYAAPLQQEADKDGERYRYVRAKPHMLLHLKNSEFDAAIDAAIAALPSDEKGK